MKKYTHLLPAIFILSIILFSGCKKYDEGPKFTLRTVQNRLTNGDWRLQELTQNGTDVTTSYNEIDFKYSFDANNNFGKSTTYYQSYTYLGQLIKVSGGVAFFENEEIQMGMTSASSYGYFPPVFSYDANGKIPTWKIKKLTNKEFWLETTIEGDYWYMKLTKDR